MTSGAARQRAERAKEIYESASREAAFAGTSAGNVLAERLAESELGHAALSDRVVALESDQAARMRGAFKLQDALTVAEERVAELEEALKKIRALDHDAFDTAFRYEQAVRFRAHGALSPASPNTEATE